MWRNIVTHGTLVNIRACVCVCGVCSRWFNESIFGQEGRVYFTPRALNPELFPPFDISVWVYHLARPLKWLLSTPEHHNPSMEPVARDYALCRKSLKSAPSQQTVQAGKIDIWHAETRNWTWNPWHERQTLYHNAFKSHISCNIISVF
jgi:hypothetical protein